MHDNVVADATEEEVKTTPKKKTVKKVKVVKKTKAEPQPILEPEVEIELNQQCDEDPVEQVRDEEAIEPLTEEQVAVFQEDLITTEKPEPPPTRGHQQKIFPDQPVKAGGGTVRTNPTDVAVVGARHAEHPQTSPVQGTVMINGRVTVKTDHRSPS